MTTDTSQRVKEVTPEVTEEIQEDTKDNDSIFYVEKKSRLIYEVKFFPEFALVRPAHPDFTAAVERIDLKTFLNNFDEYFGIHQVIRDALWGKEIDSIEIGKQ